VEVYEKAEKEVMEILKRYVVFFGEVSRSCWSPLRPLRCFEEAVERGQLGYVYADCPDFKAITLNTEVDPRAEEAKPKMPQLQYLTLLTVLKNHVVPLEHQLYRLVEFVLFTLRRLEVEYAKCRKEASLTRWLVVGLNSTYTVLIGVLLYTASGACLFALAGIPFVFYGIYHVYRRYAECERYNPEMLFRKKKAKVEALFNTKMRVLRKICGG
jgi:hypothetical protein